MVLHYWYFKYKIPEFLLPKEATLDMAKRLIAYKQKISEQWLEKKNNDIINLHKNKKERFKKYYYIRDVLNNPIDPIFNFPEIFLSIFLKASRDIEIL